MNAGELDRTITILRPSVIDDGFQRKPSTPTEYLADVPAKATPVRDSERFAGGEMRASLTYRFVIRWSPDAATIRPTDGVLYEGSTFGIAGPVKEIGRREWIEITAGGQVTQAAAS